MRLEIPRLRLWHLLGFVATGAAFLGVMQFRWSVEDAGYNGIRQLSSLKATERAKAASDLGLMRPPERRAIAPLTEALFDIDAPVRAEAARSLFRIVQDGNDPEAGFVKAALISALGDREPESRRAIALSLANFQPDPEKVVPVLVEFTRDGDEKIRREAVNGLGQYVRRSETARVAVFAALGDPDIQVRLRAVRELELSAVFPDLAPEPLMGSIITALVKAADDESSEVRVSAILTLGGIASRTRMEIPRVIEALRDPEAGVRLQAAASLRWRSPGRRSDTLIPALVLALQYRDANVRQATAYTFEWLGLGAEAALPALRTSVNDPDKDVRERIGQAIEAIEEAVRNVEKTLKSNLADLDDDDPNARAAAANWLGSGGPRSVVAIPALVRRLSDREAEVRRSAAYALGQLGAEASVAVPKLAALAESDLDERVRRAASLSRTILLREAGGEAQGR